MGFFIQDAWAQGAATASDPWLSMLPLVIIFVVFYFLLIRPQQKRQKEHKDMVAKLTTGDEVVTAGGVLGKVSDVGDSFIRVDIANGVQIIVQRHTIGAVLPKGTIKNA